MKAFIDILEILLIILNIHGNMIEIKFICSRDLIKNK